jgi:IS4 transposase
MLEEILERFEQHAPVMVMGRMALEHALDPAWVDAVFDEHRQRQYSRELLFSTVVELVSLVSLGLRPSLHAAARKAENLPVSLAALYDKVRRTEPAILRGLVCGSADRLGLVVETVAGSGSLPGWQLRVIDGNHLPGSEKRLKPLRQRRGAALPGHALVVYDPDSELVTDMVACEDAYDNERMGMMPLLECAQAGQLWIADRNFCSAIILKGWEAAGAHFVVREHGTHPRLTGEGELKACGRVETGKVYEQQIGIAERSLGWRRIELHLDKPTQKGDTVIRLWSNLPSQVGARRIAELYRKRWRIEGMFQRLESVLKSEITSLGHPRAALLGFAVALLAYNILATLKRCVEFAHREKVPQLQVSTYHLALHLRSGYEGMLIALPASHWQQWANADPHRLTEQLLRIAQKARPPSLATAKRAPKIKKTKEYVNVLQASTHFSTHRILKNAKKTP